MPNSTESRIKSPTWFAGPSFPKSTSISPGWSLLVGLAIAAWLCGRHSMIGGGIVATISILIATISYCSPAAHRRLSHLFTQFGNLVGHALGIVILFPMFFVVMTGVHGWQRLWGIDPLQLRNGSARSFWQVSDSDDRKRRYSGSMFATDSIVGGRVSWRPVLLFGIGLLIGGELLLQAFGYGDAFLYEFDPQAGYIPAPNQHVNRFGGEVITNRWGMRGPDFSDVKPASTLRILMLGDSTLFGGQYVTQSKLYARIVQERLTEEAGGRNVEVLNMGVNGWGPFHELGYVRARGTYDADLCFIHLPVDDLSRPLSYLFETPYFRSEAPPRCAYEEVANHLNWRFQMRTRLRRFPLSQDRIEQQVRQGTEAYLSLARILRDHDCEVHFEILPSRTAGTSHTVAPNEQSRADQMMSLLQAEQIPCRFPVGLFQGFDDDGKIYHDNIHLDTSGHAIYADYLTNQIRGTNAWRTFMASGGLTEVGP